MGGIDAVESDTVYDIYGGDPSSGSDTSDQARKGVGVGLRGAQNVLSRCPSYCKAVAKLLQRALFPEALLHLGKIAPNEVLAVKAGRPHVTSLRPK